MTMEERKEFIRLVFTLLEATGAKTLTELHHGRFRATLTALKAYREMPEADRTTVSYLWDKLVGGHTALQIPVPAQPQAGTYKGRIRVSFFPLLLP